MDILEDYYMIFYRFWLLPKYLQKNDKKHNFTEKYAVNLFVF